MKTSYHTPKKGRFAHLLIWTIRNQDLIAYHIRIYVWSAVAVLLLLTLSQKISIETALCALLFCGLSISIGLWIAIERRRSWLLSITDPDLRLEAYHAMLTYLAQKTHDGDKQHMISFQIDKDDVTQKGESYTH